MYQGVLKYWCHMPRFPTTWASDCGVTISRAFSVKYSGLTGVYGMPSNNLLPNHMGLTRKNQHFRLHLEMMWKSNDVSEWLLEAASHRVPFSNSVDWGCVTVDQVCFIQNRVQLCQSTPSLSATGSWTGTRSKLQTWLVFQGEYNPACSQFSSPADQ